MVIIQLRLTNSCDTTTAGGQAMGNTKSNWSGLRIPDRTDTSLLAMLDLTFSHMHYLNDWKLLDFSTFHLNL